MAGDAIQETWQRLMGLLVSQRNVFFEVLQELELTPPHGHALLSIHHGGPTRMRDLADHMACDASYITNVADRLEELGLVERRPSLDDRRAKELVLTAKGRQVAAHLQSVFVDPPAAMRQLSPADQKALARIARQLFDGPPTTDWMPPVRVR